MRDIMSRYRVRISLDPQDRWEPEAIDVDIDRLSRVLDISSEPQQSQHQSEEKPVPQQQELPAAALPSKNILFYDVHPMPQEKQQVQQQQQQFSSTPVHVVPPVHQSPFNAAPAAAPAPIATVE